MKLSALLAPLIAAKAPHDQIMAVIMAFEAQDDAAKEAGLEKARARWHRWDEKRKTNVSKRLQPLANDRQQLMREGARVEDNLLTSEIEPQEEVKKVSKPRAVRLPDGFEPDLSWAEAQGLSSSQAKSEAAKFRDYWTGKGSNATKTDWPATWRNWARTAAERMPTARGSPVNGKPSLADGFAAFGDYLERQTSDDHGAPQAAIQFLPPGYAK